MQPTDAQGSSNSKEADVTENPAVRSQPEQALGNEDAGLDPIFDSNLALQMFEASLDRRKRSGEEAFPTDFDWLAPPEKIRLVEPPQTQNGSPPDETPSLSSPNSSQRPDQSETVPNTPAGAERSQTPDSLFDSFDPFEDSTFPIPAPEIVGDGSLSGPWNAEQSTASGYDVASHGGIDNAPSCIDTDHPAANTSPSVSNLTKQRFSLNDQDVIANASREMLQRVDPQLEYTSPYPVYGGPLGYLPSSPGIHVKCIEVAENRISDRMGNLRRRVGRLDYERNKYKAALSLCTTVDQATGKTKVKLIDEENGSLRRALFRERKQAEEHKQEAEKWKNKFTDLAMTYNNLLLDFQAQQRAAFATPPANLALPGSSEVVHQPRHGRALIGYPNPNQQPAATHSGPPRANRLAITSSAEARSAASGSETIDLTDEEPRSPRPRNGPELLRSFRNKEYGWLGNGAQTQGPGRRPMHDVSPNCERGSNHPSSDAGQRNEVSPVRQDEADDDLAREMEEELARA